jgi:hypothetical protein
MSTSVSTLSIKKQVTYQIENTYDEDGEFMFCFLRVLYEQQNGYLADDLSEVDKFFELNEDTPTHMDVKKAINEFIEKSEFKLTLVKAIKEHVTDMTQYSFYGSQNGIPEDSITYVADSLLEKFNIVPK